MRILGIDTSTKYARLAIVEDGVLIACSLMQFMASHSEKLIPEIAHMLEIMEISLETIDCYALTVGPGSFTGLRVAVSTVKGLSFATRKPVIAVSTLEIIARGLPFANHQICPILDARKKELYAALFKWQEDKLIRIREDSIVSIDSLVDWIEEKTIFLGEGVNIYKDRLMEKLGNNAIFAENLHGIPNPALVAIVGEEKAKRGEFVHAHHLEPLYLRKSEAEIKFG
ncbi:tRNA (adenosine(37)-N6)-threonylcarbamoyltransferase complex dimerization subunit type 1 TsaB [Thermodesulfovibrio hydrogeniphilus]